MGIKFKSITLSACLLVSMLLGGVFKAAEARSYVIVNVQTQSPERGQYTFAVAKSVKKFWKKPSTKSNKIVDFSFSITKEGALKNLKTVESSGSTDYDNKAKSAIEKSAPYPKLPADFGDSVKIDITFRSTKD